MVPSQLSSLIAREVVLRTGLPRTLPAHTTSRACATSLQAATEAADRSSSATRTPSSPAAPSRSPTPPSSPPTSWPRRSWTPPGPAASPEKVRAFAGLSLKDVAPVPPALKEPTTGLTMGESAEKMAWENGISREAQDRYALESQRKAADAWASGKFAEEVMAVDVPPRFLKVAATDNNVRADTTYDALASLKPVFDRRYGTITAGNSSPLTDGAAAVMLMTEGRARELGFKPLGFLRAYAYAAIDPGDQLLQGPAYAAPVALDRAGLTLADMDLVEMHEAFAAQVALQPPGLRLPEVRRGEAGARRAARRDRPGPAQRQRRVDRARPPLRRHRRPHDHPGAARAGPPQGAPRAAHRLRRRRTGRRGRPRRTGGLT